MKHFTTQSDHVLVLTTWPDSKAAREQAQHWLQKKLAACVNILPEMQSLYIWEEQLEQGKEHQLLIKTCSSKLAALQQAIVEAHPYECPEILVLPITGGLPDYLNWITGNTE